MQFQICSRLADIEAAAWDALVPSGDPFTRHAFLSCLETSGSVGPGTGWLPCHLVAYEGETLVAALVLYEKNDSFGEFIFDWAWAQAAARAGIGYYPKLVSAIPFTPATGSRLLVRAPHTTQSVMPALCEALDALQQARGTSGVHVLFCSQAEQLVWQRHRFAPRRSQQFHWQREAQWNCFDDYLASLRTASRKQVRKERERAQSHGLRLAMEPADALSAADRAAIYMLYRQTVWEKGAQAYLTPAFFDALGGALASLAHVAVARQNDRICAMALFFCHGENIYGRYWGAAQQWDALHFELCYYLPMQWALQRGCTRFEAGAQGEHKLKRGFLPSPCYSAHALVHPGLAHAVGQFVAHEARAVDAQIHEYAAHTPFKRGDGGAAAQPALPAP